ncbi:hypothetical protein AB0315_10910 [Micrococcus luteus]|uniref:hypothetical protein n=1 Tax=Micrococcus luteus TaxID=1270 RepID=UPI00344B51B3
MTSSDDDTVLWALSHPGRRALLDALHERDGQSVTDLGQALPALGRVAKGFGDVDARVWGHVA